MQPLIQLSFLSLLSLWTAVSALAGEAVSHRHIFDKNVERIVQIENQSPFISKAGVLGSGIVISPDGYIAASNVPVEAQERVTVRFENLAMPLRANVVGRDKDADIALLKVRVDRALPYFKLEEVTTPSMGDPLTLLSRAPRPGLRQGIVASVVKGMIVSDIVNAYDSRGGVLLDAEGAMVGVVSKRFSGQYGFGTVPAPERFVRTLRRLVKEDRTVSGFFGMSLDDLKPSLYGFYGTDRGVLITDVDANMSADRAGLKKGDLIVRVNQGRIRDKSAFCTVLYGSKPDDNMRIGFVRNRIHKTVDIRLPDIDQSILNPRAYMYRGMMVEDITGGIRTLKKLPPYLKGVYVTLVKPDSQAEAKGFRPGDVILQVNTKTVDDLAVFKACVGGSAKERFFIYRDGWNFIKLLEGDK